MTLLTDSVGPYDVGATAFTLPVHPPIASGTACLRDAQGQLAPALLAEQVDFIAYYPTPQSSQAKFKKGLYWLTRPLKDTVGGYSHFITISPWVLWPAVVFFGAGLKAPVYKNSPPLRSPDHQWSLVLFSHGLGSNGMTYSQMCSHLASHGHVVLAFEHHDGSGPIFRPRSSHIGRKKPMYFLRSSQVAWDNSQSSDADERSRFRLRVEQLAFRHLEIYLGYQAFSQLVTSGEFGALRERDGMPLDPTWVGGSWVQCSKVAIIGHSFGGGTVTSMISTPPPEGLTITPIPISHAVALDPWLDPLSENPEPSTGTQPTNRNLPQLLVVTSERIALWPDHFARLLGIVRNWIGSTHVSFCDFPVMLPPVIRSSSARQILRVINTLVLDFINDRLAESIDRMGPRRLETETKRRSWYRFWAERETAQLVGEPGNIVVHIEPPKL
ncbi:platelet-activating factor acetylhydrolase [Vararia minispora EC-137]|uniref:Platelet-activating factor acetylhydrolase n=1 Tax=Vararia minispora EC-137 TaxID=1314806 RepID=A0ACB8QIN9_9AGAM|nr:platelet-activating factor acetylhydrolase [Vararia minispora EC-137]